MSTITKARAQEIFLGNGPEPTASEERELARIALASLEAEPAIHRWCRVTVEPYGPYPWHYGDFIGFSKPVEGIEDEYFYSAPPVPVSVPDEREAFNIWNNDTDCPLAGRDAKTAAWLAWSRRAAMLQGAEPVSNRDELPDGWVACSERMPEGMVDVITSNGVDVGKSWWDGDDWKEWNKHDAVPGKITHWHPMPSPPAK